MFNRADAIGILYVGDNRDNAVLQTLRQYDGERWYFYTAKDLYDALATYILYNPHITILVGESALTEQTFFHITSLNSPPLRLVDGLLIFADSVPSDVPATTLLRHYRFPVSQDEVRAAILSLMQEREDAELAARGMRASAMPSA